MSSGYSSREVLRKLQRAGFVRVSQRGSHLKVRAGSRLVIVRHPSRDISAGTLASILVQAGLTRREFESL